MSSEKQQQARLLDLIEHALTQPPAERDAWLEQHSDPVSLTAARRLLDLAQSATSNDWELVPEARAPVSLIARQIGAYRIVSLIGEGGMGQVYLAHRNDGQFEQSVAIKVVRAVGAGSALHRQFDIERQILANLRHPNIASLLDGGTTDDGLHYVVMEYVDGIPLGDYLDAHRPDLNDTLHLFVKICRAVQSAHQALIIHRDIKPGNILVTPQGEPKLLDFGIAKVLPSSGQTDAAETILGALTPDYASPEQVRGEPLTTASDVYALGVVLYEALTGVRPHDTRGLSPAQTEHVLTHATATPPSQRDVGGRHRHRHAGADLDAIVLRALSSETQRRYGAAGELADDIKRFLRNEPVTAQRDSTWYRLRKLVARNRVGAAAVMLTSLAVVAALAVSLWQVSVARQQRALAETQLARTEAVSDFLGEILLSPSSNWDSALQTGANASVSELLDAAQNRLQTALPDMPDVRIDLLTKISEARLWLHQPDQAEALMQAAVATADSELSPNAPLRVEVRYHLGNAYLEAWEYASAVNWFDQALRIGRDNDSLDALTEIYITDGLALAHSQLGDFQRALDLQKVAAAQWHAWYGDEPAPAWSEGYASLTYYAFLTGDLKDAEAGLAKALQAMALFPAQTHAMHAEIKNLQATLSYLQRRDDQALAQRREAIVAARQLFADNVDKEEYVYAASHLAMRLCDRGELAEAATYLDEIDRALGDYLNYADGWAYHEARAWCANAAGDFTTALEHSADSRRLGTAEIMAPGAIGQRARTVAASYAGLGKLDEAEAAAARSVKAFSDWLGPTHTMTRFVRDSLSDQIEMATRARGLSDAATK